MILSRLALGLALKLLIKREYLTVRDASISADIDERELRRCWSSRGKSLKIETVIRRLEAFGYEVHFTIRKKGDGPH